MKPIMKALACCNRDVPGEYKSSWSCQRELSANLKLSVGLMTGLAAIWGNNSISSSGLSAAVSQRAGADGITESSCDKKVDYW